MQSLAELVSPKKARVFWPVPVTVPVPPAVAHVPSPLRNVLLLGVPEPRKPRSVADMELWLLKLCSSPLFWLQTMPAVVRLASVTYQNAGMTTAHTTMQ